MKKWYIPLLAACLLTTVAGPSLAATVDPAVQVEHLEDFYLTSGKKYDEISSAVLLLPQDVTKRIENTYIRIDKNLVSDYFYDVSLYDGTTHVRQSHFFVAKDKTSIWELPDGKDPALVYGTADELLKKVKVVVYPTKIPLGSYGIIRIQVPGNMPYDIKLTSLNTSVASISDKLNIIPVKTGKTDIVIDLKIGNAAKTVTQTVQVIDTADGELNRDRGRDVPISVGIGIGWGGGWHRGGGIGIGVGPWW